MFGVSSRQLQLFDDISDEVCESLTDSEQTAIGRHLQVSGSKSCWISNELQSLMNHP